MSLLSKSENRLISVRSFDLGVEIENRRVIVISARFVRGGGSVGLAAGDRRILLLLLLLPRNVVAARTRTKSGVDYQWG